MLDKKALLALPVFVYFISYLYLSLYHGRFDLLNVIVHEGGLYTFLQTLLYASHFLGHIPVHTALALYFVGTYLCLSPVLGDRRLYASRWPLVFLLVNFLLASVAVSLIGFGIEDTMAFILQQKQNVRHYTPGGSWNLHLPSTLLQLALIPVYIVVVKRLFAVSSHASRRGSFYAGAGLFIIIGFTCLVNNDPVAALSYVLGDPRHLAHSVREIATFPLIYYPLPLYFFLLWEKQQAPVHEGQGGKLMVFMGVLALAFFATFLYQVWVALAHDVDTLSQKPAFMKGESLGIAYLLASHYFEHFLDAIYFLLISLILYVFAVTADGTAKNGKI